MSRPVSTPTFMRVPRIRGVSVAAAGGSATTGRGLLAAFFCFSLRLVGLHLGGFAVDVEVGAGRLDIVDIDGLVRLAGGGDAVVSESRETRSRAGQGSVKALTHGILRWFRQGSAFTGELGC